MPPIIRYLALSFITLSLILIQFSSTSQAAPPSLREQLALKAKPSVVRVIDICRGSFEKEGEKSHTIEYAFSGSGFIITPDGYILTSATAGDGGCEALLKKTHEQTYKYFNDKQFTFTATPERRVFLPGSAEAANAALSFSHVAGGEISEDDISIIKVNPELDNAPSLVIGDSDGVGLDDVTVVGYSQSVDKSLQVDSMQQYEASVSDGKISNANRVMQGGLKAFELALAGSYYAGSPVLDQTGKVIAIILPTAGSDRLIKVDDVESNQASNNDRLTLAIPAKKIKELLTRANVQNRQGQVDQFYASGLESFWKGDYKDAKDKFEVVQRLYPQHSEIEKLLLKADTGRVDTWSKPPFAFWGVLAAVAAFVLGLVLFLMRRKSTSRSSISTPEATSPQTPSGFLHEADGAVSSLEVDAHGQYFQLPLDRDEHLLGRDPEKVDLVLPESWEVLSRHHATLKKEGGSYRIFNNGRNPMLVNEHTLVDPKEGYLLRSGDTITVGKGSEQVRITYYGSGSTQVKETKVAY